MKKRDFIKYGGLLTGAMISSTFTSCGNNSGGKTGVRSRKTSPIKLTYTPYTLQLKHVFTLAAGSRTTTPVVLTKLECDGFVGYGEASMPPYLGESHESVQKFLSRVNMEQFSDPFLIEDILEYVDGIAPGNYAAKASIDIALHDLAGKIMGQPWYRIWGLNPEKTPCTSFTIGDDTADVVREKVAEAEPYKILKVKLGVGNDKNIIETIRSVSDKPIGVDVNQGWKDRNYALEMAHWLKEQNVIYLEQPMPKTMTEETGWLTQNSPLPVIADEAFQTKDDLFRVKDFYDGINIKLMKCGGMNAGYKLALMARAMGMKIMVGCMTETSCAISAAAQFSPLVDWADLDGNLLISNDIYDGVTVEDGRIILKDRPGIGIIEL
jgi:L-alanine-DL-glutamate epimerase-like enolase superfamily enzyme